MSQIEFENQNYVKPNNLVQKTEDKHSFMVNMLFRLKLAKTNEMAIKELIIFSVILICIAIYFFIFSSPSQPSTNIKYLSADGQTIIKQ